MRSIPNVRKRLRDWGAPQLVHAFKYMHPDAHIVQGRDSRFLSQHMQMMARPSEVMVYYMLEYGDTGGPWEVPSFLRWASRQDDESIYSINYFRAVAAEWMAEEHMPMAAQPAMEPAGSTTTASEDRARMEAAKELEQWLNKIL